MISNRPYTVWWLLGGLHYQLVEVQPDDFANICQQLHDVIGIPCVYTFIEGEVEWWPQCGEGEFVLVPREANHA